MRHCGRATGRRGTCCTWYGKHQLPLRGRKINTNISHNDKVYAFARIAFEWMQKRWLDDTEIVPRAAIQEENVAAADSIF